MWRELKGLRLSKIFAKPIRLKKDIRSLRNLCSRPDKQQWQSTLLPTVYHRNQEPQRFH